MCFQAVIKKVNNIIISFSTKHALAAAIIIGWIDHFRLKSIFKI